MFFLVIFFLLSFFFFKTYLAHITYLCTIAGHIPINRSNRDEAIQSIESAKEKVLLYNRSIAISPEGTRSTTGMCVSHTYKHINTHNHTQCNGSYQRPFRNHYFWFLPFSFQFVLPHTLLIVFLLRTGELGEFKKGPFHLARAVGAPLVPLIIRNAHSLWPPGQLFTESGDVA